MTKQSSIETDPTCPNCGHPIRDWYSTCPDCAHDLRVECDVCGELITRHHSNPCICCQGDPGKAEEYRAKKGQPLTWEETRRIMPRTKRANKVAAQPGWLRARRMRCGY